MYTPKAFELTDPAMVDEIVAGNSFGWLLSAAPDGEVMTTAMPFLWDRAAMRLEGHIARANPHKDYLTAGARVTALFQGAHAYVSPRWYVSAPNVPTWNYLAVKMSGRVALYDDAAALEEAMARLARVYEGDAWRFADQPQKYRDGMLRGVHGFKIAVDRIEAKAKLSQNRAPADRDAVASVLAASAHPMDQETARWMLRLNPSE